MKRIFFSVVLIATAVCAAAQQKDWANFGRYAEANAAIEQSPDVVFMGNSITDNWARMDPDFFAKNNFVGRGISGQTSRRTTSWGAASAARHHPRCSCASAATLSTSSPRPS